MVLLLACYSPRWGEAPSAADADGDGHLADVDCDDTNADVYPGAHGPEVPGDGVDVDCDGRDACVDFRCDRYDDLVLSEVCEDPILENCADFVYETTLYVGGPEGLGETLRYPTVDPVASAAADLDGDGFLDLVLVQSAAGALIYWGTAEGPAVDGSTFLAAEGPTAAATGDIDGDGLDDLLLAQEGEGVAWLGAADRAPTRRSLTSAPVLDVAVADLDGDGQRDVVFVGDDVYVLWGGALDEPAVVLDRGAFGGVDAADLTCDGHADLLLSPALTRAQVSPTSLLVYGGAGRRLDQELTLQVEGASKAAVGDLDHDDAPDVAFASPWRASGRDVLDSQVSTLRWGPLERGEAKEHAVFAAWDVALADVNGDAWADVVYASLSNQGNHVYTLGPRGGETWELSPFPAAAVLGVPAPSGGCSP